MGVVAVGIPHLYYSQRQNKNQGIKQQAQYPQVLKTLLTHTAGYNEVTEHRMGKGRRRVCTCMGGSTCMGCGGEEGKEEKTNNLVQDATGIVRHLPLQCVTSYPKNGYFTTRAAE